jgi:hypothetical protein
VAAVVPARSVIASGPEIASRRRRDAPNEPEEDERMTTVKIYHHQAPGSDRRPRHDERGEGVISAAIAVLIMAFIGVGMWVAFNATFQNTARNVNNQVNCIGQSSNSNC